MSDPTPITPEMIESAWRKWGDGRPLKPGFAAWLAGELNRPMPRWDTSLQGIVGRRKAVQ